MKDIAAYSRDLPEKSNKCFGTSSKANMASSQVAVENSDLIDKNYWKHRPLTYLFLSVPECNVYSNIRIRCAQTLADPSATWWPVIAGEIFWGQPGYVWKERLSVEYHVYKVLVLHEPNEDI